MKRILIVDDQSTIRWMIRLALREHFAVDEADNPQAAWGMIKKRRPDGIVLDVLMPGGTDGFQFCKRLKSDPRPGLDQRSAGHRVWRRQRPRARPPGRCRRLFRQAAEPPGAGQPLSLDAERYCQWHAAIRRSQPWPEDYHGHHHAYSNALPAPDRSRSRHGAG
jgi:CheY-like chemotaxis protein